jgi:hypothetical protein
MAGSPWVFARVQVAVNRLIVCLLFTGYTIQKIFESSDQLRLHDIQIMPIIFGMFDFA